MAKIDGRKNNRGRYGKKNNTQSTTDLNNELQNTENTSTENATTTEPPLASQEDKKPEGYSSNGLNQQHIINEMAQTGINPHPKMTTEENTKTESTTATTTTSNTDEVKANNIELIDPTKLSTEIENKDFSPNNAPVKEEDYRNPVRGQGNPNEPIPEPVFKKPSIESIQNALNGKDDKAKATDAKNNTPPTVGPVNPNSTNILANDTSRFQTAGERGQGAAELVDSVLDVYGLAHQFGAWVAKVNLDKLTIDEMEGKIDLSVPLQVSATQTKTLKQFLEQYNLDCEKNIAVDEDFVNKVRPIMIRVAEKRGWGLTDEERLLYLFGRDIFEKSALIYGMKKGVNDSLKYIMAQHKQAQLKQQNQSGNNNNQSNNNSTNTETTQTTTPQNQTGPVSNTENANSSVNEFVDKTTETDVPDDLTVYKQE